MPLHSSIAPSGCKPLLVGALALVAALAAQTAHAAPAPPPAGKLTGMWMLEPKDFHNEGPGPFTAAATAAAEAQHKAIFEGGKVLSDDSKKCLPAGMPMLMTNEFALEILETPGRITVVSEMSPLVRTIYLDRKAAPDDALPMWNGYSVGHWEGDTLVVEVTHLNDRTPHIAGSATTSDATRIVERYHLENGGKDMVGEMTFTDPNVLTKPWTVKHTYHRLPADAELWEYACEVGADGWQDAAPKQ